MPNLFGTGANQVPLNSMLGSLAYQDADSVNVGSITYSGVLTGKDNIDITKSTSLSLTLMSQTSSSSVNLGANGAIEFSMTATNDRLEMAVGGFGNMFVLVPDNIKTSAQGSIEIPRGTTTARTASPNQGSLRKNTDTGFGIETYIGSSWKNIPTSDHSGYRNRLDNGDFIVSQRVGKSNASSSLSNDFASWAADRWFFYKTSDTSSIAGQRWESDYTVPGYAVSTILTARVFTTATPSSASAVYLAQSIDPTRIADLGFGKTSSEVVTLSFWVKASNTGTYVASLVTGKSDAFNVGDSNVRTYSITQADTWQQVKLTFPSLTVTSDRDWLSVVFCLASGSNYHNASVNAGWLTGQSPRYGASTQVQLTTINNAYISFSRIQLEKGSIATEFESLPYSDQLARCQRFFCKSDRSGNLVGVANSVGCISRAPDSTASYVNFGSVRFPVEMVDVPTIVSIYNPVTTTAFEARNFNNNTDHPVVATQIGVGGFNAYVNNSSISAGNIIGFHYYASCEPGDGAGVIS